MSIIGQQRSRNKRLKWVVPGILATWALASCGGSSGGSSPGKDTDVAGKPNILFIVLDDFGLDQLDFYGYGGTVPPKTPNLQAIAEAGLKFRHAWAMPTCTPTRATFFTGRYPSSTNILNAVVQSDLANSEISPYEMTLPKLLKTAGYSSAMIGKMHLTGTNLGTAANLPYGLQTMWKLGFDHFDGYLDGAPYPIDTRAGLKAFGEDTAEGPYHCGFVPNATIDPEHGADIGACYYVDNSCEDISKNESIVTPGRACMEQGGIFVPNKNCQESTPTDEIDFAAQNGYYTGKFVWSNSDGEAGEVLADDASARGYRSTLETDRAIAWANAQPENKPWMLSLGYSALHAPLQLPPLDLIAEDTPGRNDNLVCSPASEEFEGVPGQLVDMVDSRLITNLMVEAMDKEIGRLLVEMDLATWNDDGTLNYDPAKSNTLVVVMGDNGTYVNSVKIGEPGQFDMTRGKGSPYQTGVAVPLLVAGPMVKEPGREVPHQISSPDLYRLFAEIAGADVDAHISADRPLDAQPMLDYLTNPEQDAVREINFAEMGTNFSNPASDIVPQPCVVEAADTCFVIFPNKELCDDQSGIWYGVGSDPDVVPGVPEEGFDHCGQVISYRKAENPADATKVLPDSSKAASDGTYKLVRMNRKTYTEDLMNPVNSAYTGTNSNTDEFYRIDMLAEPNPVIDREGQELAIGESPLDVSGLSADAQAAYAALSAEIDQRDAVATYNYNYDTDEIAGCPGDGNRDLKVDETDLANWEELSELNKYDVDGDGVEVAQSTWYDFNHDGKTDEDDKAIIEANLGKECPPAPSSAP